MNMESRIAGIPLVIYLLGIIVGVVVFLIGTFPYLHLMGRLDKIETEVRVSAIKPLVEPTATPSATLMPTPTVIHYTVPLKTVAPTAK